MKHKINVKIMCGALTEWPSYSTYITNKYKYLPVNTVGLLYFTIV